MSAYAAMQRHAGNLKEADADSKCTAPIFGSQTVYGCYSDNGRPAKAVHKWNGQNYCGFHSPFSTSSERR